MKTLGIVAEYNPFHLGHAYHLTQSRRETGADTVVIAMGGNFTQRGGYAYADKFARAEMAIRGGADLVIELPVSFSLSSAERFAYGGVYLLSELADYLSFGCETSDLGLLERAAGIVSEEGFTEKVKAKMQSGVSFAMAREAVLREIDPACATLLSSPNNILAVEYLKAIKKLSSRLIPFPVARIGAWHGEMDADQGFASASAIREMKLNDAEKYLPEASFAILTREKEAGRLMEDHDLWDAAMLSSLRRLSKDELSMLPDVREGLENRLYDALHSETSVEDVVSRANSRRYPSSRIRRCLMQGFLGLTSSEFSRFPSPLYIRVLAFNDVGRQILSSLRSSPLPIITRGGAYRELPAEAQAMFSREIVADDIYTSLYPTSCERKAFSDLYKPPIYIP